MSEQQVLKEIATDLKRIAERLGALNEPLLAYLIETAADEAKEATERPRTQDEPARLPAGYSSH